MNIKWTRKLWIWERNHNYELVTNKKLNSGKKLWLLEEKILPIIVLLISV